MVELTKIANEKKREAEPFLVAAFTQISATFGDKSKAVRETAVELANAIVESMSPFAVHAMLPHLLVGISVKAKPQQKELTLNVITLLASKFPHMMSKILVIVVTPVADLTCDIKKEVKAAAVVCMEAICQCTGNRDLEPFLPAVILAAQSITNTHSCVDKLAGCIFVQNVECPALAATLPVLARGLTDKSEEVNRTCCQIVDNMCKLVEDPAEVLPLMPRLEPLVKNAKERISDPEARAMSERAYNTLMKAAGQGAADVVVVETAEIGRASCRERV